MLVVLTTVSDRAEAEKLAKVIVDSRYAACVQVLPKMRSFYFWEGELHSESEHLLLIKTLEDRFERLSDLICEKHSYDVPEIVALSAESVSEGYLSWVTDSLGM